MLFKKIKIGFLFIVLSGTYGFGQTNEVHTDPSNNRNRQHSIDDSQPELLLDSLKSVMKAYDRNDYQIVLVFRGYESSNEEVWYFDTLAVLCGYRTNWNMEGTSGEDFYWFDEGKLSYVYAREYGQDDEPVITFLKKKTDNEKLNSYHSDIYNRKQRLIQLINENIENKSDDRYNTITIEETKNYGGDVIETTSIYISNLLFKVLF